MAAIDTCLLYTSYLFLRQFTAEIALINHIAAKFTCFLGSLLQQLL